MISPPHKNSRNSFTLFDVEDVKFLLLCIYDQLWLHACILENLAVLWSCEWKHKRNSQIWMIFYATFITGLLSLEAVNYEKVTDISLIA